MLFQAQTLSVLLICHPQPQQESEVLFYVAPNLYPLGEAAIL